ncbi:MAG: hypothetical protein HOP07_15910 [Bacteriovoracaceae bacterium]|nr:hypothetical protein [Bacteriovoracaceae bacterium]
MMKTDEYIFWVIPDLAEKPRTYLIYRANDRTKAIAIVVFENKEYDIFEISNDKSLTFTEQLNILEACDIFLQKMYFYNWD